MDRLDLVRIAPSLLSAAAAALCAATAVPGEAPGPGLPERLAGTGLYADFASRTVAPDVHPYAPQYPLWTDGAQKRRWIQLPPGGVIDASDPDEWRFHVGTKLWKEFSLGRRIETRFLEKRGEGDWLRGTYVWSSDESDARLAPERGVRGAAESAPGVPYDVPGRTDCAVCHARGDGVIGFSALQLSPDRDPLAPHAEPPPPGALDTAALIELGWLRGAAAAPGSAATIAARSPRERAVLGYLHGNCGYCHAETGLLAPLGLRLDVRLADGGTVGRSIDPTPVLASLVGRPGRFRPHDAPEIDLRVEPGRPEQSSLLARMATRQPLAQMPPLGTNLVDAEALSLFEAWIREDLPGSTSERQPEESNRGY